MTTYVAFLRGINAGVTVKMAALRQIFEELGLSDVQTVLATGNVIFAAQSGSAERLAAAVEKAVVETLGYQSVAVIMSKDEVLRLMQADPFAKIKTTPTSVPQVSFLKNESDAGNMRYPLKGTGYVILGHVGRAVCSTVDLSGATTPDLMKVLDNTFGKSITTRNWNSVRKVAEKLQAT